MAGGDMDVGEKAKRKALRDSYKRGERERQRALMYLSEGQLDALLDHVASELETDPCDNTLRHTTEWARAAGVDQTRLRDSLIEFGGGCDCEVVLNIEPEEIFKA